ncbi:MAG TPA: TIGR00282 family metallophosphoesterase [Rectinemataceae bacterium]|nr:TIGR00282 family metallophosphoesterase [Rectinemataceae bacterium]
MSIRVLYVAEIVGKAGVFTVKRLLPRVRREYRADFVIGNADSATGGAGLGKQHAVYLRKLGLEAITTGECVYYKRDIVEQLPHAPYIIRPANYPYGNPGRGYKVFTVASGRVAVVQLLGQAGFPRVHLANPFQAALDLARKLREECPAVLLDFHAATTAEKRTMAYHLDGLVSAVVGSHTKAMTADACILPKGTAYITDAGRTGSIQSVGGLDPAVRIREFMSGIPAWSRDGTDGLELQGCLIEIGDDGRARSIETLRIPCPDALVEPKPAAGETPEAGAAAEGSAAPAS